jgi:hypothetical protein
MKLFDFVLKYRDNVATIAALREERLLAQCFPCPTCGERMSEATTTKTDGLEWRCYKRTCRTKRSIRSNSFFTNANLSLSRAMLFVHLWVKEYPQWLIVDDFDYSVNTVVDWSRFCRDVCLWYIENKKEHFPIGGQGREVEIDETLIVRRKYNRGRLVTQQWLFGGVERHTDGTWDAFIEPVSDRSEATLTEIIQRRIRTGTRIISDGWAAYANLNRLGYLHSVVNHSENFVDPDDASANTQKVENFWMLLKRFLRAKGTHRGEHNWEYICEFLFRKQFHNTLEALLDAIRLRYPLE